MCRGSARRSSPRRWPKASAAISAASNSLPICSRATSSAAACFRPPAGEFVYSRGPIFANIVLADEINRTTPRTQSALLEAMSDRQVSIDGKTYPLPLPFMVIATQNPFEFEGTYPLPESQLDRFLMRISIGYPGRNDDELQVLNSHRAGEPVNTLAAVIDGAAEFASCRNRSARSPWTKRSKSICCG